MGPRGRSGAERNGLNRAASIGAAAEARFNPQAPLLEAAEGSAEDRGMRCGPLYVRSAAYSDIARGEGAPGGRSCACAQWQGAPAGALRDACCACAQGAGRRHLPAGRPCACALPPKGGRGRLVAAILCGGLGLGGVGKGGSWAAGGGAKGEIRSFRGVLRIERAFGVFFVAIFKS